MDDAGVVGPVDVEAGRVGDNRVALDGRLEARVDLPARGGEADQYAYAPWVDPPGTGNGAKKWTLIAACACEVLRKSRVRCRTTSKGTTGQFGVVEPAATAGRFSPGGVSLKRTSGDVRSTSRMFIRARRGLASARGTRDTGTAGLLCSLDVRDAGKQRSDDGLRLHSGRAPEGQTRSDDQTGSSVGHHTSLGHRMRLLSIDWGGHPRPKTSSMQSASRWEFVPFAGFNALMLDFLLKEISSLDRPFKTESNRKGLIAAVNLHRSCRGGRGARAEHFGPLQVPVDLEAYLPPEGVCP